jgi:hypothetical protein
VKCTRNACKSGRIPCHRPECNLDVDWREIAIGLCRGLVVGVGVVATFLFALGMARLLGGLFA